MTEPADRDDSRTDDGDDTAGADDVRPRGGPANIDANDEEPAFGGDDDLAAGHLDEKQ